VRNRTEPKLKVPSDLLPSTFRTYYTVDAESRNEDSPPHDLGAEQRLKRDAPETLAPLLEAATRAATRSGCGATISDPHCPQTPDVCPEATSRDSLVQPGTLGQGLLISGL